MLFWECTTEHIVNPVLSIKILFYLKQTTHLTEKKKKNFSNIPLITVNENLLYVKS